MPILPLRAAICFLWLMLPVGLWAAAPAVDADFFEKRIRPLLADNCTECHGVTKQKANLRLDFKGGWATGGDSGPAIMPGHADGSLLWKAVSYTDRDLKMPPKKKLSEAQLADLKTWIDAGAPDPRESPPGASALATKTGPKADGTFWSFQPPQARSVPLVRNADWPANNIDRFILAKLEANGLQPAADATAATLLRRLTFDLTGLPPTAEALRAAPESIATPQALEKLVDSLLATPAFAERWASHWLDITRFAESSGGGRSLPFKDAWRFRDYLLESLRDNVPVNRMITEMLAGDLLPHATPAERRRHLTATGFLALGPTNYEEQDKGMLRMDIVDEQLDTIGRSFLGMTIGCARCHDHKFDPIPTRDYYALAGIFRSTRTLKNYTDNVAHWIDSPLPMDGEKEQLMQAHEKKVAALTHQIAELKDRLRDAGGAELRTRKSINVAELPGLIIDDSEAMKVGEWKISRNYGPFIGESYVHDLNAGKGEKTITFNARPKKTGRFEVRVAYIAGTGRAERIPVTILHADGEELIYMKQATEAVKGLQFASLGAFRFEAEGQGYVLISNSGAEGYVTVDAVQLLPADDTELAKVTENPKVTSLNEQITALTKELKALEKTGLQRPEAMSVAEDPAPEDARIHIRGSIRNLGAPVPRGFLQVVLKQSPSAIPADQSGRLQLAEWMTSRQNPLTARVVVNRVWHWLFGAGIVRTTDNFGSTGEAPSHPELLDHLAIRFMESGWDLKRLIKDMVLSRTYRQSSESSADIAGKDPDNRLLSRMNRKRLDAECLRDAMLAIAGTMDSRFGGPGVSEATAIDSNDQKVQNLEYGYAFSDTRRSVYTAAFRNVRHPLFEVFDFADINQPIAQRTTSTVATQALFMMNHPFVIDQARAAAGLVLASPADDSARLQLMYQTSLGREPSGKELALSLDYLESSTSGNATASDIRDTWARLIQTLWATPEFRFLK